MVFHGRYKSREAKKAAEKARKEKRKKLRAEARKKRELKAQSLIGNLRAVMGNAGLKQIEISDFSGVSAGTLVRIEKKRHISIQLSTFVAIANACGYDVQLVEKDDKTDEFSEYRTFRRGDIE